MRSTGRPAKAGPNRCASSGEGRRPRPANRQDSLDCFARQPTARKGPTAERMRIDSPPAPRAVPKSRDTKGDSLPAMTMEEVRTEENLRMAFENEARRTKAHPDPDRQSIDEVREHLDELLPELVVRAARWSYTPGEIRRVWIPKGGAASED